jgi:hypothetical protein
MILNFINFLYENKKFNYNDIVNSENFKNWFKDSKIVDNGLPIIVWHQNLEGNNDFTEFKPKKYGDFENSMFYFAKDKNWVKNWIKNFDKSQLTKSPRGFFLKIVNPLDLRNKKYKPQ